MTPEQFTYWLQGYAELNPTPPTIEQWQSIRENLAMVFNKVTPPLVPSFPQRPFAGPMELICKADTSALMLC